MYKRILVPIDNSLHSKLAVELAINLAQKFSSELTGLHVYAARLHDERFRQMEPGLPSRYQEKQTLEKQRNIHNSLISDGLRTISDSYLDHFQNRCEEAGVVFQCKVVEGKHYVEILKETTGNTYDLVIMGILGLGAVEKSLIGSVCERVTRKIRTDILITKPWEPPIDKFLVAVDGSSHSVAALQTALELAQGLGARVEVISAFDPYFHVRAFKSIAGVLSEEASKSFRFKDQERLHEEIINEGLAKIYRSYLEEAGNIASQNGQEIKRTLLSGKPFEEIVNYIDKEKPSLLVIGRVGAHRSEGLDIGSTTENLLRLAPCNILIVNR
jgi:nucleotide-binding universal stress UspA family protein